MPDALRPFKADIFQALVHPTRIAAANLRSSSGLVVIAAAQDDKRHWIESGRLAPRLCLTTYDGLFHELP